MIGQMTDRETPSEFTLAHEYYMQINNIREFTTPTNLQPPTIWRN